MTRVPASPPRITHAHERTSSHDHRASGAQTRRWPWGSAHGPLPVLLITLTLVTGVVDAVSYLALGHVFVANMTGNVVFLGFALAGAPGLSAPAALAALGAFLLGALAGGRIAVRSGGHRGRQLRTAMTIAVASVLLAVLLAAIFGEPLPAHAHYALIVPLAIAMGIQNATARRLAVPDLTTTVLTLTLTGIAADSPARRRHGRTSRPSPDRRDGDVHRRAARSAARDQHRPRAPTLNRRGIDRRQHSRGPLALRRGLRLGPTRRQG
jgi:hypothetical protein